MTEGNGTCGEAPGERERPQGGRTTPSLAPVRPLWGRLESVYLLSAGSMTFGHSTRGYSHSPPLGTGRMQATPGCSHDITYPSIKVRREKVTR